MLIVPPCGNGIVLVSPVVTVTALATRSRSIFHIGRIADGSGGGAAGGQISIPRSCSFAAGTAGKEILDARLPPKNTRISGFSRSGHRCGKSEHETLSRI